MEHPTQARPWSWWRSPLLLLAAACAVFIYLFTKFASEVVERETGGFDAAVRAWVLAHRSPAVVSIFSVITHLGAWYSLMIAALVVAGVLVRRGARKRPLVIATAPFLLSLLIYGLKKAYGIDRPGVTSALTLSFPSGHTTATTAVAIVLGYVLVREGVAGRGAWVIAIAVLILVGVSRVFLDMHWASDVIGGWMIGAAYAAAVCALYEHTHRRSASARLDA